MIYCLLVRRWPTWFSKKRRKEGTIVLNRLTDEAKSNDTVELIKLRPARAQNRGRKVRNEASGRKSPDRDCEGCVRAESSHRTNNQPLPVSLAAVPGCLIPCLPHCGEWAGETGLF